MVTISLLYIGLLFGATLYNHFNSHRVLFLSSVFALFMYVAVHLGNSLWLMSLSAESLLVSHYLFYAASSGFLALGLFWINRKELRVVMAVTITLLTIEAMLGYAVHIDRNVVALNGAATPNISGSSTWFLWDLRNYLAQLTTLTVLLALTLPRIYQVKSDDNHEAYSVLMKVEEYLSLFDDSERKQKTQAFLDSGAQILFFFDTKEPKQHRIDVGLVVLNEAIKLCCYEPHRNKPVSVFGRFVYWLRS